MVGREVTVRESLQMWVLLLGRSARLQIEINVVKVRVEALSMLRAYSTFGCFFFFEFPELG